MSLFLGRRQHTPIHQSINNTGLTLNNMSRYSGSGKYGPIVPQLKQLSGKLLFLFFVLGGGGAGRVAGQMGNIWLGLDSSQFFSVLW